MKVILDAPYWFVRPKNTDWRYVRYQIERMSSYIPVDFVVPKDIFRTATENIKYTTQVAQRLIGYKSNKNKGHLRYTNLKYSAKYHADLLFTHSSVPIYAAGKIDIPVVWQHAIIDPNMQQSRYGVHNTLQQQVKDHQETLPYVDAVLVSTESEVVRHSELFPETSNKYYSSPFFLPDLDSISNSDLNSKYNSNAQYEILFVGREGVRKGLDILLNALDILWANNQKNFKITIVSSLSDGDVNLTRNFEVDYYKELPYVKVKELMKNCHIFAMPSKYESYGFTYIEAMAFGCAVIGPNWEVQSSLLKDTGYAVEPNVASVAEVIGEILAADKNAIQVMGSNALHEYQNTFTPEIVAKKYYSLFEQLINKKV